MQPAERKSDDDERTLPRALAVSESMKAVLFQIPRVAAARRTTLICGPTGTGKEVVARELHQAALNEAAPFVSVHCAALPEGLVESELFGHARGSFTGATQARSGLVRAAASGTLFLDEIDSLSLPLQAKLLRFIESGEYRPVGSDRSERSEAWVLAATNADLHARVLVGTFREDLLHRLDVMRIDLAPLRERTEDILPLAEHFVSELGPRAVGRVFSKDAQDGMCAYAWPGNVRELKHKVERAAFMASARVIEVEELGLSLSTRAQERILAPSGREEELLIDALWALVERDRLSLFEVVTACETALIDRAIAESGSNRRAAARRLRVHVRTIFKKLRRARGTSAPRSSES